MPQGSGKSSSDGHQTVVDFNEARSQKLEEKRRVTERIFFKHLLNVYSIAGDGMAAIEFIDMSDDGCSFQVLFHPDQPSPINASEIPLRIYFSQDTYLEIRVTIQNSRPSIENNQRYIRYGCKVDRTTASYAAYTQFVKFLKLYAEHSHKDLGKVTVFYL